MSAEAWASTPDAPEPLDGTKQTQARWQDQGVMKVASVQYWEKARTEDQQASNMFGKGTKTKDVE